MKASLAAALLAGGLGVTIAGCRAGPQSPGQPFPVLDAKARVLESRPAACPDRSQTDAGATAFREAAAWRDHLATLSQPARAALASWQPEFRAGESVLLAHAGHLPNPGYRVAVAEANVAIRAGVLQVRLTAIAPPDDSLQAQVMTPACLYLWLERADYREVAVDVVR